MFFQEHAFQLVLEIDKNSGELHLSFVLNIDYCSAMRTQPVCSNCHLDRFANVV